jgi:phage terminase large subunit-like protein
MWDLSCPDWEERLRVHGSLVPELPLDLGAAERAVTVFNKLRLSDVEGTPALAEAGGDWFRDIVRAIFGSVDETGTRLVREIFCLVPKKNSKTTNGALLMLTALLLNKRPRAKFIMTGPTQDVAELAFAAVKGAIELDDVLTSKLQVRDHLKLIRHRVSGAELEIMTFDPNVLTGQKAAGILVDELHVSAKMAKAASAVRQLRGGMQSIPEAFLAFITTQSEDAPVGVFRDELMTARRIRDGRQRGVMLPVLYEFPEAMQKGAEGEKGREPWRDPANWPMVTPNLGRSINIERLKQAFDTESNKGEAALRTWASQHLNIEIGLALHSDRWAGADHWEEATGHGFTLGELINWSDVVTVGIDGGGLDDLLGLCVIGREIGTRRWLMWGRAWAHPVVLKRRKEIVPQLQDFAADGDLVLVQELGEDVRGVVAVVKQIHQAGKLGGVGLDPVGIGDIVDELAAQEIGGEIETAQGKAPLIQGIPQGWRLSAAIKTLERALAAGTAIHGGQPLMAWAVSNAKAEPRGNAISITKQAAGTAKIDPLVAAFNAVELMTRDPKPAGGRSFWESDEFQEA